MGFFHACKEVVTQMASSLYKKHRKYIGKRAGKGYNVRESVIDKIQTIYFCFVRS